VPETPQQYGLEFQAISDGSLRNGPRITHRSPVRRKFCPFPKTFSSECLTNRKAVHEEQMLLSLGNTFWPSARERRGARRHRSGGEDLSQRE